MANNGERGDLEAIRQDMSTLRDDLSAVLSQLLDTGKESASNLRDKGVDAGKRAIEATEAQIKERPFLSIMVVFLVGLLLGKMLDQRLRG